MNKFYIFFFGVLSVICLVSCSKIQSEGKKMISKKITIFGEAVDTKANAAVLTENKGLILINQLDYWSDDYIGKTVRVIGILEKSDSTSQAGKPTDKLIKQGEGEGEQMVLKNAIWSISK
jgi:hypothetical protein